MKPPPFEYFCPATLDEAVRLLAGRENAKVLAGGQSLMAMLNLRYVFPDALIDINNLHDLAGIDVTTERIRIGAMTRQRRIELDGSLFGRAPIFRSALKLVGHRQTRNRGTIGGSLCHLDPASELPLLALLLDATIEAIGPSGLRRIAARDFIAGFMMPGIGADEIVTAIEFSPWSLTHTFGFDEFARRHGDFAIASSAVHIERNRSNLIERAAIAIGGIGSIPQRHSEGEKLLIGTNGDAGVIAAVADACDRLEVVGDFHGGPEYRLSVARAMLKRSLKSALPGTDRPVAA